MLEAHEMDGGLVRVMNGWKRVILDLNGVFKRTEDAEPTAAPASPSAMDAATAAAAASQPAALDMVPPASAAAPAPAMPAAVPADPLAPLPAAGGFQVPT